MHGVVRNHGFADGNKRTALYLVELMVQRSGYELAADDDEVTETLISVAHGEIGYERVEEWFRERLVRQIES